MQGSAVTTGALDINLDADTQSLNAIGNAKTILEFGKTIGVTGTNAFFLTGNKEGVLNNIVKGAAIDMLTAEAAKKGINPLQNPKEYQELFAKYNLSKADIIAYNNSKHSNNKSDVAGFATKDKSKVAINLGSKENETSKGFTDALWHEQGHIADQVNDINDTEAKENYANKFAAAGGFSTTLNDFLFRSKENAFTNQNISTYKANNTAKLNSNNAFVNTLQPNNLDYKTYLKDGRVIIKNDDLNINSVFDAKKQGLTIQFFENKELSDSLKTTNKDMANALEIKPIEGISINDSDEARLYDIKNRVFSTLSGKEETVLLPKALVDTVNLLDDINTTLKPLLTKNINLPSLAFSYINEGIQVFSTNNNLKAGLTKIDNTLSAINPLGALILSSQSIVNDLNNKQQHSTISATSTLLQEWSTTYTPAPWKNNKETNSITNFYKELAAKHNKE